MPVEVVMPKFGLTMREGTIQKWFRTEGESVTAGDPLFEVETEKVLYEVESPADGIVAAILYEVESVVPVGSVVAVIAVDGDHAAKLAADYHKTAGQGASSTAEAAKTGEASAAMSSAPAANDRIVATPSARKLAREKGIELSVVKGSGPGGRITREDVEAAASKPQAVPEKIGWDGVRKRIAARMFESLQTTAQLTITTEADVTNMVHRRARLKEGQPITYNDLLVHAVANALRKHPRLNCTVESQAVRVHEEINIGVAVALDEGLIVPVIRNADRKSPLEIARESRELAEKARTGALGVDEVSGGTFTISNLGMYGVDAFTPIIDLPQVAILGVGRVREKPLVYEGEIAIRHTLVLSLTFDHRAVDGAPAAAFLKDVIEHLTVD